MKIQKILDMFDSRYPNGLEEKEKIELLSFLDSQIKRTVIDTHEGGENITFEPYTESTNLSSTELLVGDTYSEMYINYLAAQMFLSRLEFAQYNVFNDIFNQSMYEFRCEYNRTHKSINPKFRNYIGW